MPAFAGMPIWDSLRLFEDFVGVDVEFLEGAGAEMGADGDVGGVSAAGDEDAADTGGVVTGVKSVPVVADIGFEPG